MWSSRVPFIWVASVIIWCGPRAIKLQRPPVDVLKRSPIKSPMTTTGYPATNLAETWFNWRYRSWRLQCCGWYWWIRMIIPRLSFFIAVFSIQYCLYLGTLHLATPILYLSLYKLQRHPLNCTYDMSGILLVDMNGSCRSPVYRFCTSEGQAFWKVFKPFIPYT